MYNKIFEFSALLVTAAENPNFTKEFAMFWGLGFHYSQIGFVLFVLYWDTNVKHTSRDVQEVITKKYVEIP